MLSMLEQALRNAASNNTQMMYGNNLAVVNNMLSTVSLVQSLKNTMQNDSTNDAYLMNLRAKIFELENIIEMYGQQRLMSCGISLGAMQPQMSPLMANQPMYNQPMYYSNMMTSQPQMPPQMPQMQQQQPPPQMQQQQMPSQMQPSQTPTPPPPPPQPAAAPTPAPASAPDAPPVSQPAPVAKPAEIPVSMPSAPQASSSGATMAFPGMGGGGGGNDKALGRDYLLKLLSEK